MLVQALDVDHVVMRDETIDPMIQSYEDRKSGGPPRPVDPDEMIKIGVSRLETRSEVQIHL